MELGEALERIEAIRAHVARTEVFRGYKATTVGFTGLLACLASAVQPLVVPSPSEQVQQYLQLWIGVAALSAALVTMELTARWFHLASSLQREQTLQAVEQFLPCLVAGASATWAVVQFSPDSAALLPGLWALMFGLGIFASCRQLPASVRVVGVYYLGAGTICLVVARGSLAFHPGAMAGTFGVGQILTAVVLYLALERNHAD